MPDDERLTTYLNDHHSGAAGARDLVEKSATNNQGTPLGAFLSTLQTAIEQDITTLKEIMELLGVQESPLKQAAGKVAETLSRLKLHDRVTGDPDLSQLLELESLAMGITGKAALWETLTELARTDTRLRGVDLPGLSVRAQDQLGAVREEHRKVATAAFTG